MSAYPGPRNASWAFLANVPAREGLSTTAPGAALGDPRRMAKTTDLISPAGATRRVPDSGVDRYIAAGWKRVGEKTSSASASAATAAKEGSSSKSSSPTKETNEPLEGD